MPRHLLSPLRRPQTILRRNRIPPPRHSRPRMRMAIPRKRPLRLHQIPRPILIIRRQQHRPAASGSIPRPDANGHHPVGTSVLIRMIDCVDSSTNTSAIRSTPASSARSSSATRSWRRKAPTCTACSPKQRTAGQISGAAAVDARADRNPHQRERRADGFDRLRCRRQKPWHAERRTHRRRRNRRRHHRGVIGGSKGAAIGASVGAGGGTAVQVLTHGEHVRIPSETLLEFKTEHDVTALVPAVSN